MSNAQGRMVPTTVKPTYQPSTMSNFFTAGLGGCLGWCVVHPFNTLAIRMNLATSAGGEAPAFLAYSRNAIKTEGVMTLYSGLSAGLLRQVFYATSRFGLFEVFRDEMAKYRPTDFTSRLITVKCPKILTNSTHFLPHTLTYVLVQLLAYCPLYAYMHVCPDHAMNFSFFVTHCVGLRIGWHRCYHQLPC